LRRVCGLRCLGVQLVLRFRCRRALSLHRLTWPRQHPLGSGQPPVSGRLYGTDGGVAAHHVPFSRCLSAAGIRFLAILFPPRVRPPSRSAHRPAALPGSRRGSHVPHERDTTGVGAPYTPGTVVSSRLKARYSTGTCRFPAASPFIPLASHRRDSNVTRHRRRFTRVHPSGLPLACDPRMGRGSLGFFPELRTPPLPATHVRAGTGHGHWPGTTPSTSVEPPISASTHLVRPRVAPSRRSRSARSLRSTAWASNAERRAACRTDC